MAADQKPRPVPSRRGFLQRSRTRKLGALAAVVLAMLGGACDPDPSEEEAGNRPGIQTSTPDPQLDKTLPTFRSGGWSLAASARGTVVVLGEGPCVIFRTGGARYGTLWPAGSRLVGRSTRIIDRRGKLLARDGQRITVGGGAVPSSPEHRNPCNTRELMVIDNVEES